MKKEKIELNVDFIGGQGSLTVKEEKELSHFFKQRKRRNKAHRTAKRTKGTFENNG